jgi:hypothetical protein
MKSALFAFLLIPSVALCEQLRIAAGMNAADAKAQIRKAGGTDITGNQAIVGPKGEWPLKEIYWTFGDFDAVIELSQKGEKIASLCYWTKKDFSDSLTRREDSRQPAKSITLDTEKKSVVVEKVGGK